MLPALIQRPASRTLVCRTQRRECPRVHTAAVRLSRSPSHSAFGLQQTATLQEQIEAAGHELRKTRGDFEHAKEAKRLIETQLEEREAQLGG